MLHLLRFTMLMVCCCCVFACEDTASTTTPPIDEATAAESTDADMTSMSDSKIAGTLLEGNRLDLNEAQLILCIRADSTTYDPTFKDSHRIFEVLKTPECTTVFKETLPINDSPDFPYYFAELNYNTANGLVAIKGASHALYYDIKKQNLSPILKPAYLRERNGQDAQSGRILRLEVWENYLIGYAQDMGPFVFDLRNSPKALLPVAEFETSEEMYNSLFMLESQNGTAQAIMPDYDFDKMHFSINALFDVPKSLKQNINRSASDNPHIILRTPNAETFVVDMAKRQLITPPATVKDQPNKAILQWVRSH